MLLFSNSLFCLISTFAFVKSVLSSCDSPNSKLPHIIFILADDLGHDDVGFSGSADIQTPNIDALAYSGIILNRYYSSPICTPSRSALMTGKHPIRTGMQHSVLVNSEPRGLPLAEKILPQYLNDLGYSSHMAGKWHLGFYELKYTPLYRGFKSHVGGWTGFHDYFDHNSIDVDYRGLDIRRNLKIAYDLHGKYTTDITTEESVRVISNHNSTNGPLFLYVSHLAPHTGTTYNPLQAPDESVAKIKHIKDFNRRKYAAMMSKLDDSVGRIVEELRYREMLNDSVIIFTSDNGGTAGGMNGSASSNWPLKGGKATLFEGGVRCAGLLWSPRLGGQARVAEQTIHVTDWLPTLLGATGSKKAMGLSRNKNLDGFNIWPALQSNSASPRHTILHNIDDVWNVGALTVGDWKVVYGSILEGALDDWFHLVDARNPRRLNVNDICRSPAGRAIASLNLMPNAHKIQLLQKRASVNCDSNAAYLKKGTICRPLREPCLFNVRDDPCEKYNLASLYPHILGNLLSELREFNKTAVPSSNKPSSAEADPSLWNYVWTNFGDYSAKI